MIEKLLCRAAFAAGVVCCASANAAPNPHFIALYLTNVANPMPTCHTGWPSGALGYSWEIHFDVDGNAATGDPQGYERRLFLGHWNACAQYGSNYTTQLTGLQRSVLGYAGNGSWTTLEDGAPAIALSVGGTTSLNFSVASGGALRGIGPHSYARVVTTYRPFDATGVRQDEIARFRIGANTIGGAYYADDPPSDSYGCDQCTWMPAFESSIDIDVVYFDLDTIFGHGFQT